MEFVLLVMVLAGALGLEVWMEHRRKKRFRNLMRKMEELSKENKYIDAYTGKVRECPIGIYIRKGEGHFLYASEHSLDEVKKLLAQGCKIVLQYGDSPEVSKLRAEGKLEGQQPTGIFEEGGQLYYIYPSIGKKVQDAGLPMVSFS